jgi:PAS domain S-box-containing protein
VIWERKGLRVVSVFQDNSEIESISKELDFFKNMKNWLDTIIDSSYDGLWICDHDGKVVRINKAAERIDDLKPDEVIGRNVRELVSKGVFDKSVTLEVIKRRTSVTMIQQVKGEKKVLVTGNPIERLIVVTEKDRIEEKDLQSIIGALMVPSRSSFPYFDNFSLKEALEKCETLILERAMKRYHSQHEIARVLKVNQATISRKIKKYSFERNNVILHNNML